MKYLKTPFVGLIIFLILSSCDFREESNRENVISTSNALSLPTATTVSSYQVSTPSPQPTSVISATPLSPSPTPWFCVPSNGQIEELQLKTKFLTNPLDYRVYLPPCYESNTDQRYPVLYLIHGYGYNDDQWVRLGVGDISDKLIIEEEIPPLIIVMPHDSDHNVQPPTNQFGNAVLYDLVREIDTTYRTLPFRQYRAIGGLSRGGNWALHIGLSHSEYFGIIGTHSAPLFVTEGPPVVKAWLDDIQSNNYPHIYIDVGDHDKWLDEIIRFEEILDEYNVPHDFYIFPGNHTEDYWKSHTEQYIRWYTKEW